MQMNVIAQNAIKPVGGRLHRVRARELMSAPDTLRRASTGVVTATPVALFVIVTVALGTTAPEESRILPAMAPRSIWPNAGKAEAPSNMANNTAQPSNLRVLHPLIHCSLRFSDPKRDLNNFDAVGFKRPSHPPHASEASIPSQVGHGKGWKRR